MSIAPSSRNRAAFSPDEVAKYAGKWIAFDHNCTKIVASHDDPGELAKLVRAAGYDPQEVWFEGIPAEDTIYGGLD